jgi:phytoene desaturase
VSRVVVIGSGMGGLAVAARLSAQGHQVLVVERAPTYGGKLARLERDGFVFDTGPSLLTLPAVYRDLFLSTALRRRGASLEENVDLVGVDPAFHYRFPDGVELDLPNASRSAAAQALDAALGSGSGAQWTALIDHAAAVWQVTRTPFLERPLGGPLDLVRQSLRLRDLRTVAPLTSLRRTGRRYLSDPRLRMMLDRYATYSGSDPRRAPAALVVVPYIEQTFGAWHIGGGLAELGRATYERCVERGVDFRFGTAVTAVLLDGSAAAGVALADGEHLAADLVVANADATHLYRDLLPPQASGPALARLRGATASSSAFTMMLAVRGRTPALRHHNVLFGADYDAEFDAMFGPSPTPVADPTVYVCAPDDPRMRPDDAHEALFVLVNAPRHAPGGDRPGGAAADGIDWRSPGLSDAYADHVLQVMATRGLDVRERLLWRQVSTPADLEAATGSPGGSIYGTSSNGPRAAFLRPANQSTVKGLFLVGGSAHPGGGLPLVGMSAEIVAGLIGPA